MDATNPYAVPEATDFTPPPADEGLKPLGSLAQSARGKELNRARWILIIVGALTLALNLFLLFSREKQLDAEIQQQGVAIDPQTRQSSLLRTYAIDGSASLLGLVFIVFGLIVKKFPVPITVAGLALYLLAVAAYGALDPMTLAQGFIGKIIIIVVLIRAIKAARAYADDPLTRKPIAPAAEL